MTMSNRATVSVTRQRYLHVAVSVLLAWQAASFHVTAPLHQRRISRRLTTQRFNIDLDGLMDMDVVIYSDESSSSADSSAVMNKIGAVQEDGTLLPLSAWSEEPAFGNSIEFLVDEEDRVPGGLNMEGITIQSIVPEDSLSYGSRQVGGGKGPGNPHGEESDLLYYVDKSLLDDIEITIKPELEILW